MPSRKAPTWSVYLNGVHQAHLQVVRVVESAGAARLSYAELIDDIGRSRRSLLDWELAATDQAECEVRMRTELGNEFVRHRGRLVGFAPSVSQGERYQLVSRATHDWLGDPVYGMDHVDVGGGRFSSYAVVGDLVFNPRIAGTIEPNRHIRLRHDLYKYPLWLAPESGAPRVGEGATDHVRVPWTLADAVFFLIARLFHEPFKAAAHRLADLFSPADQLVDVRIPFGTPAAVALDKLLAPYGYSWWLEHRPGASSINVFKQGAPISSRRIKLQRRGERFEFEKTELAADDLGVNTDRLVNQVLCKGGLREREVTVELQRGWPSDQDALTNDDLRKTGDTYDDHPDAWRLWVLNEAGQYNAVRDGNTTFNVEALFAGAHLAEPGTNYTDTPDGPALKRKFLATLTRDGNTKEAAGDVDPGIFVEFYNPVEEEWEKIGDWGCKVSDSECSIRFDADEIPSELIDRGANARIRVTATIPSVHPIVAIAHRRPSSLCPFVNAALIDLGDGYPAQGYEVPEAYRSRFYAEVQPGAPPSPAGRFTRAVNSAAALFAQAVALRDTYDQAEVSGRLVLEGLDRFFLFPGLGIRGIEGRTMSYRAGPGEKYPQITAIEWDVGRQRTIVSLHRMQAARFS